MNWKLGKNFYSSRVQLFNLADLDTDEVQQEIKAYGYHLYLICKRKKIHFINCHTSHPDYNTTAFFYLDDNLDKVHFSKDHSKSYTITSYKDNFYYGFSTKGNFELRDFVFHNLIYDLPNDDFGASESAKLPTDLEIMYVGQSYGSQKRLVPKKIDSRVWHHEKVQEIALEILDESSDCEILIIGVCIEAKQMSTLALDTANYDPNDLTMERLLSLNDSAKATLPGKQEVTLCEGSLIRHFQSRFNQEYKTTFPGMGFISYGEIYNTDFDYISMALDTKNLGARVYSAEQPVPRYVHLAKYALQSDDQKKEFFDYLFKDFEGNSLGNGHFDVVPLIDKKNAALWELLNDHFEIDIKESDEPNYRCYITEKTATIYILPEHLCKDSFTHELLHIYLKYKGLMIGNQFDALITSRNTLNRIFSRKLLEHFGNCLDHIRMYPMYEEMGFDPRKFITDNGTFKLLPQELASLKKHYKEGNRYNTEAIDFYIGKFIAIFADYNPDFDYEKEKDSLRKIDPVLYGLLEDLLIKWEDMDIEQIDIQIIISKMLDSFYNGMKKWMTGKTFAKPH
jgi:hypothetical protein